MSYFITRVFKDKQELLKKERGPRGFNQCKTAGVQESGAAKCKQAGEGGAENLCCNDAAR